MSQPAAGLAFGEQTSRVWAEAKVRSFRARGRGSGTDLCDLQLITLLAGGRHSLHGLCAPQTHLPGQHHPQTLRCREHSTRNAAGSIQLSGIPERDIGQDSSMA